MSVACSWLVSRSTSRLMRVRRTSIKGMAPAARAARISSIEKSSGISIMSKRTRSPFLRAVEYSMSSSRQFCVTGISHVRQWQHPTDDWLICRVRFVLLPRSKGLFGQGRRLSFDA